MNDEKKQPNLSSLGTDMAQLFDSAAQAYDLFRAFSVAGFTENQALKMAAVMLGAPLATHEGPA